MAVVQSDDGVKIEVRGNKRDERLEYLLNQTEKAVAIFTKAIRDSPEDCESVGFKAFTLKSIDKPEVDYLFDLIITKASMEITKHSSDLKEKYTFFDEVKQSEEDELKTELYLFCKKVPPPVKEVIEMYKTKEEPITDSIEKED